MSKSKRYSPEFWERAVRMLLDHKSEYDSEWSAMNAMDYDSKFLDEEVPGWSSSRVEPGSDPFIAEKV